MAIQINRLLTTCLILWACLCFNLSEAHEEEFDWDVTTLARDGKAKLRIKPDSNGNTVYEFTTKQVGVYDMTHFRVAFQWLRNLNDNSSSEYESVVFQMALPLTGQFDDSIIEVVQLGNNWNQFSNGLGYNDFLKAILFNKTGFVSTARDTSRYTVKTQQVSKYFSNVEVKLTFTIPGQEPIGEHRVWYRWAFYKPYLGYAGSCDPTRTCLGLATIDGNDEPFFWSQYVNLLDYMKQEDIEWLINLYWIMTALTLFGILGLPIQVVLRIYTQVFILDKSIKEYNEYKLYYADDETTQAGLVSYLTVWNLVHTVILTIMNSTAAIPVIGPVTNLLCTLGAWAYIDVQSRQQDFDNYTGNTAYL